MLRLALFLTVAVVLLDGGAARAAEPSRWYASAAVEGARQSSDASMTFSPGIGGLVAGGLHMPAASWVSIDVEGALRLDRWSLMYLWSIPGGLVASWRDGTMTSQAGLVGARIGLVFERVRPWIALHVGYGGLSLDLGAQTDATGIAYRAAIGLDLAIGEQWLLGAHVTTDSIVVSQVGSVAYGREWYGFGVGVTYLFGAGGAR